MFMDNVVRLSFSFHPELSIYFDQTDYVDNDH